MSTERRARSLAYRCIPAALLVVIAVQSGVILAGHPDLVTRLTGGLLVFCLAVAVVAALESGLGVLPDREAYHQRRSEAAERLQRTRGAGTGQRVTEQSIAFERSFAVARHKALLNPPKVH